MLFYLSLTRLENKLLSIVFIMMHLSCKNNMDEPAFNAYFAANENIITYPLHIEVESSPSLNQVFYNIDANNLDQKPLLLRNHKTVSGHINTDSVFFNLADYDKSPSFFDIIAIPHPSNNWFNNNIYITKTSIDKYGNFNLNLMDGLNYMLILNQYGEYNYPPLFISDTNNDTILNDTIKLITITGSVTNLKDDHWQKFLRFTIHSGARQISSTGKLDKDNKFTLKIADSLYVTSSPLYLLIEAKDNNFVAPKIVMSLANIADIDLGAIDLGDFKDAFSIKMQIKGEDNSIIQDALVYLKGQVGDNIVEGKVVLDNWGRAIINVYEGSYDIAILPDSQNAFGMKIMKNVTLKEGDDLLIKLPRRSSLSGNIISFDNKKINGALIELFKVAEKVSEDMSFFKTAITNENGNFCSDISNDECALLFLDEGRYHLRITPPFGSNLAIDELRLEFPLANNLTHTMKKAQMITGRVLLPNHDPASKAFITIYEGNNDMITKPKIIAHSMTDDNGYFKAFILP